MLKISGMTSLKCEETIKGAFYNVKALMMPWSVTEKLKQLSRLTFLM
ncbi:hypothetical protein [Candidatus Scalindua japonica]|nr:hypothetical protein [Candidatus Scalindua japonica]